jgi:hypothetical protein
MSNCSVFWGGRDYIPFPVYCEVKGLCRGKGLTLLMSVPEDQFGEANYTSILERDLYILMDKPFKHFFKPDSEDEILCIDKTLVIALQIKEGLNMFKITGLRRVI